MSWVSGVIEFENPPVKQQLFEGNIMLKKVDALILQGIVMENEEQKPVPEALVMIYTRSNDGKEILLGQTFSNKDGYYLLHVDKKNITEDATAIVLRANANELST